MTGTRKALYSQRGMAGDHYVSRILAAPDYSAGDAQFLDDTRPHDVQMRPILPSERTPNSTGRYPRGTRMLVFKPLVGMELRALVRMPSSQRANTEANVQSAVARLAEYDRAVAKLFEFALDGTSVVV